MSEQIRAQNFEFDQKNEYLIFHNLERVEHQRALGQWPLHITVVPPFRIPDSKEDALRNLVQEIASDHSPILLQPGRDDTFGPNFDVPVTRVIDTTGELHDLHMRFMWDLGSVGCDSLDAAYTHEKYSPHMTWKQGAFPPTSSFALNSLSIAKKTNGVKTMLETTEFGL